MRSALLTLLLTFPLAAQQVDTVDKIVRESMTKWQLPGVAVAIVKDDRVVYLKGYGDGGGASITPDTLFQIASTSKAFTTAAMAILVDEKKMRWDDPVRQHLDYFRLSDPCADSLVTLRDIVSHRTGLSRHDELWDYGTGTRQDILRHVSGIALSKPIRSAYQYQNIMFMAATEAVASAAGMPFEEFAKTRLFQPIGMRSTVMSESDWVRAEHSASFRWDPVARRFSPNTMGSYETLGGAGSIKSNARDMAQWLRFQLADGVIDGQRIVSAEALSETKSPQTLLPNSEGTREDSPETIINTYGLGWRIQDYRGELLVSHGGALNSFRTQVALLPKQHAGVVVLSNSGRGYGGIAMKNMILDLLLNAPKRDWNAYYMGVEQKADDKDAKDKREREAKRHRDTKPSRELAAYTGTYDNKAYGPATVTLENDQLMVRWGRLALPLTHYHFDTFSAVDATEDLDEQVTFTLDSDGDVKTMKLFGEEFSHSEPRRQ